MTREERMQKIESYGNGYVQLTEALKQFPKEMWLFKPSPDRWSIHEIIMHIADSEANAYVKCRKLIAEPGKPISAYDQDKWSAAFHYQDQSTEEALELFRRLRLSSHKLIKALPEPVWLKSVSSQENETVT
ncbi:MAG: DinB family protein, partial [Candidatus Brocadia sp.]